MISEQLKDFTKTPFFPNKNDGQFIGYDIIGLEWGGFIHSYLCNGLQKDIAEKFPLTVNDYSLIQNPYEQVKEFADYIQGKGEPVYWIPVAMYEHTP